MIGIFLREAAEDEYYDSDYGRERPRYNDRRRAAGNGPGYDSDYGGAYRDYDLDYRDQPL